MQKKFNNFRVQQLYLERRQFRRSNRTKNSQVKQQRPKPDKTSAKYDFLRVIAAIMKRMAFLYSHGKN